MFVYVGKSFTATSVGLRRIDVCCEKCSTDYFFELVREGRGSASAPYYIGQTAAAARAKGAADRDCAKRLAKESEMVPCPKCHWINRPLVKGYAKTRYRVLGVLSVILGFAVGLTGFLSQVTDRHFEPSPAMAIPWGIGIIVGLAGFGFRAFLRSRINPNKRFPAPPVIPEGTPRALIEGASLSRTPDDKYQPEDPSTTAYPDWVVFKIGELDPPADMCCECGAPPTTHFKAPLKVSKESDSLAAPLCDECKSRLRGSWFVWALATIGIGMLICGGLVFLISLNTRDLIGPMVGIGTVGLVVSLIMMFIVPTTICRPYSLKTVDGARSIHRIKFRYEPYTEAIRKSRDRIRAQIASSMDIPLATVAPVPPPLPQSPER